MRTLIYKRTHPGDPDSKGIFGINDCMGRVRKGGFKAIIGVGGIGAEPKSHGIAGKVNWIGIGPHKEQEFDKRGPIVTFEHFLLYDSDGPSFVAIAPLLAGRIYARNIRVVMDELNAQEQAEVEQILALAKNAPPSSGRSAGASRVT